MPSKEIDGFRSILKPEILQSPAGSFNSVVLKEKGRDAKLKHIEIRHLGADCLIIFPDAGRGALGSYSPLFDSSTSHTFNKACDAVILCTYRGRHYRIFIELKSGLPQGYDKQFQGTACFLKYLRCILEDIVKCPCVTRKDRHIVFNTSKSIRQTLNKMRLKPGEYCREDECLELKHVNNNDVFSLSDLIN